MKPWMHDTELAAFQAVLWSLQPAACLEWGSGGSTVEILKCTSVKKLVSVEHTKEWSKRVAAFVQDKRLKLVCVKADKGAADESPISAWAAKAEQDPSLLRSYVLAADAHAPFDFVFVDGRARRFCLKKGYGLLRPGGVMLLHDAQRPVYHDVLTKLKGHLLPTWKQGQMAIVRKS